MEVTPRPVIEVDDPVKHNWPKIDWYFMTSERFELIVEMFRQTQRNLLIAHGVLGEANDPDPTEKYYIFFCLR